MSLGRQSGRWTPGRRRTANKENIYELGTYGRKTGLTLKDTGVRDAEGFEPVSGIFSSPVRHSARKMRILNEPLPILRSPRKSLSPRKVHIGGSPVRQRLPRTVSPLANNSFAPRSPDHGSDIVVHRDPSSPTNRSTNGEHTTIDVVETDNRRSMFYFGSPQLSAGRDNASASPNSPSLEQSINDLSQVLEADNVTFSPLAEQSPLYPEPQRYSPTPYHDMDSVLHAQASVGESNTKRKRASGPASDSLSRQWLSPSRSGPGYDHDDMPEDVAETTELDAMVPFPPETMADSSEESADNSASRPKRRSRRSVLAKTRKPKPKPVTTAPMQDSGTRLRSTTPFAADDGVKITRSGRASIKPLEGWRGEKVQWQNGYAVGIVRAHDAPTAPRVVNRRKAVRRAADNDHEEPIPEDLLPEAWEYEMKVIAGPVLGWDAERETSINAGKSQDIAYAAQMLHGEVARCGGFSYAKIATTDFYGAGIVILPPNGNKRMKNSRKNHMVFLVHTGKVTATVAGMTFGMTAGGAFIVPRGNDYALINESPTYETQLFFSQGSMTLPPGYRD